MSLIVDQRCEWLKTTELRAASVAQLEPGTLGVGVMWPEVDYFSINSTPQSVLFLSYHNNVPMVTFFFLKQWTICCAF